MKDELDAQGRAEEQRHDRAPPLVRASQRPLQRALCDAAQGERGRQQEEGAPEVGAPDEEGRATCTSARS